MFDSHFTAAATIDSATAHANLSQEAACALLRRYEPVLCFTRGERFFPIDAEPYVEEAGLWYQRPGNDAVCIIEQGNLTLETLGQVDLGQPDAVYFLKFAEPLEGADLYAFQANRRRERRKDQANSFVQGTGRLARVGYASRFVDAFFNIALLARGRVPGDTAAAAELMFEKLRTEQHGFRYHGRVVRQGDWLVIQYWYFYVYNNWRTGFSGANDHEADWEMVSIYLAEVDGPHSAVAQERTGADNEDGFQKDLPPDLQKLRPVWISYATHDYEGDDLRRRWDDPELELVDEHPVVYVAAGSHANYYSQGEYLTELELAFLHPLAKVADLLQKFWVRQLRQYQGDGDRKGSEQASNFFRIPFVDYARGDGIRLGYGGDYEWEPPHLLDPNEGWLRDYRGLWGLYARDPFAGENAPAGPMYNRDRSMRRAWYDPVGWSGLDKVATPAEELQILAAKRATLRKRQAELQAQIEQKSFELRSLNMAVRSMRTQPHLHKLLSNYQERMETLSSDLAALREELVADQSLLRSLESYNALVDAGMREPPRAHIRRAFSPTPDEQFRAGRLAEVWAAASIGLMLVVLVGLIYFARQYTIFGLSAMIALFAFIEATFRGRIVRMVTSVTIGLAIVAALILLYEFFWPVVALLVVTIGTYLLWENLRELWR